VMRCAASLAAAGLLPTRGSQGQEPKKIAI